MAPNGFPSKIVRINLLFAIEDKNTFDLFTGIIYKNDNGCSCNVGFFGRNLCYGSRNYFF